MFSSVFVKNITGILVLTLLSLCFSCREKEEKAELPLPAESFSEGDIVFRRGTGLTSRIVLEADAEGKYSHVGILKRVADDWWVIHAVPGEPEYDGDTDRVKFEPLSSFFASDRAVTGAIMRLTEDLPTARKAATCALQIAQRGTLFDHQYDLKDTTKMYCTELVDFVYRKAGLDLSEGRLSSIRIPGLGGNYLLPSDLSGNKQLKLIFNFSR